MASGKPETETQSRGAKPPAGRALAAWAPALALAAMAGCSAYVPEPDALMAGGNEAVLGDLRAGRELYVGKCSGCHSLLPVDRFDDAHWTSEVEEMIRLKKVRLSREDRDRLLLYLTTANKR